MYDKDYKTNRYESELESRKTDLERLLLLEVALKGKDKKHIFFYDGSIFLKGEGGDEI